MIIPFPDSDLELTLPLRFEKIAALIPDQPAVYLPGRIVVYDELNRKANRLAHAIVDRIGSDSEPVILVCEHGLSVLIGIWAALKAGKFYVAISPSRTSAEQSQLAQMIQARLIVADTVRMAEALALAQGHETVLNLDTIDNREDENIPLSFQEETPAALFYTSGSTGHPKGVLRGHRMLLHHYQFEITASQIGSADCLSFIHDCAFAGSTSEIFRSLLSGAAICPLDIQSVSLSAFLAWLKNSAITCFHSSVPLFQELVDILPESTTFPNLRLVSVGGGKVYAEDFRSFWRKMATNCTLRHTLSASESGLLTCEFFQPGDVLPGEVIPAGFPIPGKTIRILDEAGAEVAVGESGEIVVTSRYMALGYWRNPELTAQKFLTDPKQPEMRTYATGDLGRFRPDGRLEHLGRKDFMVKIRGHQVNLNDVENAFQGIPGIHDAVAVAYQPPGDKNTTIAAYITPESGQTITTAELRRRLAEKLYDYMIPSSFTWMEEMPLTLSGKIDRKALPAPDRARPALSTPFAPPKTPVEQEVAQIWQEILGVDGIGRDDIFLELGGHSLHAMQIVTRILSHFQVEIPLPELFAAATVAEMAFIITANLTQELLPEATERLLAELTSA